MGRLVASDRAKIHGHRHFSAVAGVGLLAVLTVSAAPASAQGPGAPVPPKPNGGSATITAPVVTASAPTATITAPTVTATTPAAAVAAPGVKVATPAAAASPVAATAGPPGTAPAAAAPVAVAPGGIDGATYAVRLRDLEASVDELKDRIRRSHTRLALLSDTILSGGASGSRAEISVENEMSSAFRLTKALVVLDGAVQYNRADDTGALADQKSIPILNGSVPPGDHTLQVVLTFQGNGYGVFSYLRSYHWDLKSSHSFTAVEGKTLSLTATALEKGGVTTPLDQRPAVEWKEKVQSITSATEGTAPGAAPIAPKAAPAAGTGK